MKVTSGTRHPKLFFDKANLRRSTIMCAREGGQSEKRGPFIVGDRTTAVEVIWAQVGLIESRIRQIQYGFLS